MRRILAAALVSLALGAMPGCGGDDSSTESCDPTPTTAPQAFEAEDPWAIDWCTTHGCVTKSAAICIARDAGGLGIASESDAALQGTEIPQAGKFPLWYVYRIGTNADGTAWIESTRIDAGTGTVVDRNVSEAGDPAVLPSVW